MSGQFCQLELESEYNASCTPGLALAHFSIGKDTKYTRHIASRIHFVRNGEKCKMHKIDWCEGGLQLADIGTKNVSEPDLTTRIKYIMVRLENWDITLVQKGW